MRWPKAGVWGSMRPGRGSWASLCAALCLHNDSAAHPPFAHKRARISQLEMRSPLVFTPEQLLHPKV
jgi:hypothetical protein